MEAVIQQTWRECAETLPDTDTTVLIYNDRWSDPVWIGYLDGEMWRNADGMALDTPRRERNNEYHRETEAPTHWMEFPEPPTKEAK